MRTIKVFSLAAACMAMLAMSGCSEPQTDQHNRVLRDSVGKAERLLNQAQDLMESPVLVDIDTGKQGPLDRDLDPCSPEDVKAIEIRPAGELNARALDLLDRALESLRQAQNEATDAQPQYVALAASVQGHVQSQKADYLSRQAAQKLLELRRKSYDASQNLTQVRDQNLLLSFYDELLRATPQEAQSMLDDAEESVSTYKSNITSLQEQIQTKSQDRDRIKKNKEKLEAKARALRVEARAPTMEGIQADIKAAEIDAEARQLLGKMAGLDYEINALENRVAELRDLLASANAKVAAAKTLLGEHEKGRRVTVVSEDGQEIEKVLGGKAQVRQERQELQSRIGESRQQAEQKLAEVSERLAELLESGKLLDRLDNTLFSAINSYGAAIKSDRDTSVDLMTKQADAKTALADLLIERLETELAMSSLLTEASEIYSPLPAPAESIRKLVNPEEQQTRSEAAKQYQQARDLYERAKTADRSRNQDWVYDSGVALTYMGEARASASPAEAGDLLRKAETGIDLILKDHTSGPAGVQAGDIKETILRQKATLEG